MLKQQLLTSHEQCTHFSVVQSIHKYVENVTMVLVKKSDLISHEPARQVLHQLIVNNSSRTEMQSLKKEEVRCVNR